MSLNSLHLRLGDEERRLMHLVPAPAVRLMTNRKVVLETGIIGGWHFFLVPANNPVS